jgi:hypothetical protein
MRRLLTSTPVAAAALFAATWIVSEPIAGLSGPISWALAGVVTVSVVPWLVFRTHRTQVVVRPYRRDVRRGWTGGQDAQPSAAGAIIRAPARHPGTARAPRGPQRLALSPFMRGRLLASVITWLTHDCSAGLNGLY